jgi:hypothetical protein
MTINSVPSATEERWLPHPTYVGYDVSSLGRVRSWKRVPQQGLEPHVMKPHPRGPSGYLSVALSTAEGKVYRYVHGLILETFVGPRPEGMESCHNNGIHTDCRAENLRWDTHSNNILDVIRHGNYRYPNSRLNEEQVRWAREQVRVGVPQRQVAAVLGITVGPMNDLVKERTYRRFLAVDPCA